MTRPPDGSQPRQARPEGLDTEPPAAFERIVETVEQGPSVDSEHFRTFLDHMPLPLAVAEIAVEGDRVIYVNRRFAQAAGRPADALLGRDWDATALAAEDATPLARLIENGEAAGQRLALPQGPDGPALAAEIHAAAIEDDDGAPRYRLVALTEAAPDAAAAELRAADTRLRELQHRVKNNLQMITALIRLEARSAGAEEGARFQRLAGRVAALGILYEALGVEGQGDEVDLGVYLSRIATGVMASHAPEGVRLDLRIDAFPVTVNVAMPAGLVVNELMTNALKHAFPEGGGGTITLRGVVENGVCTVSVADDGIGLPPGETWPRPGRLGALIVRSLEENAGARLTARNRPGGGVEIEIRFAEAAAAPRPAPTPAGAPVDN